MILEELPHEIVNHITGFLVNENSKTIFDVENYTSMSLVNEEFKFYVSKFKLSVMNAFNLYKSDKQKHINSLREVLNDILYYIPLMSPVCSNDRCIGCDKDLPYWSPVLNTLQYREIVNFNKKFNDIPYFSICGIKAGFCKENKKCIEMFHESLDLPLFEWEDEDKKIKTLHCKTCRNRIEYTLIDNINTINKDKGVCSRCYIPSNFRHWRF